MKNFKSEIENPLNDNLVETQLKLNVLNSKNKVIIIKKDFQKLTNFKQLILDLIYLNNANNKILCQEYLFTINVNTF